MQDKFCSPESSCFGFAIGFQSAPSLELEDRVKFFAFTKRTQPEVHLAFFDNRLTFWPMYRQTLTELTRMMDSVGLGLG